jgi:hypothetical protein
MGILDGASAAVGGVGRGSAGSRTSGAARLLSSGWALPAAAAAALLGAQEVQAAASDEDEYGTEDEEEEERAAEEYVLNFNHSVALKQARQHTADNKQKLRPPTTRNNYGTKCREFQVRLRVQRPIRRRGRLH